MKTLLTSKTFWAGISAVVAAAGGYLTGAMDLSAAIQTAATGVIGIFLRDAIRTSSGTTETTG